MSVAKVVEVNASSTKSFEDAIQSGINKVTETVKNVQGAWINLGNRYYNGCKSYNTNISSCSTTSC